MNVIVYAPGKPAAKLSAKSGRPGDTARSVLAVHREWDRDLKLVLRDEWAMVAPLSTYPVNEYVSSDSYKR
jgi:hypothetical protein